nr:DNA polymerase III subunit delta [uncultured Gammaproteobacteria bacterium]BAL54502.1 DNA polymerase III subunit delta [uncultured Gammaproteobacteria bacterium]
MRVGFDRLAGQLADLAPVYLLYGEEPLQLTEAADLIRRVCRAHGFTERRIYTVLPGFDWSLLAADIDAVGLFSERRLLEVWVPDGKVSPEGAKVLLRYAESPPEATVLLLRLENLPAAVQKAPWFVRLEALGVAVQVRLLRGQEFLDFLADRARSKGLDLEREALHFLAARTEGNLLAAAQEIDKLYVLYGRTRIDAQRLFEAVADSARFNVFDLTEAWLMGQVERTDRILAGLRAEGVAPAVVLWAITGELRRLLQLLEEQRLGIPVVESLKRQRLWDRRKVAVEHALRRLKRAALHAAIRAAVEIDAVIKGQAVGDAWGLLRDLCLALATAESVYLNLSE